MMAFLYKKKRICIFWLIEAGENGIFLMASYFGALIAIIGKN